MNLRQYFKNIDPETKAMWRKVLWLLILCLLAFGTGYYTSQDKMDKVLTTNLQIFNDSIKVSKLRQDSLVLYIKALEERKQQIIYKTKTIVKEYEKNIDDYNLLDTNERVSYLSKWLSENDKR
jgi:hypothetical protein